MSTLTGGFQPGIVLFGVGALHHLPFRSQRQRLLRQALDVGFRHFDVAPAYGNGLNEVDLGTELIGYSSLCQVTTKFGIPVGLYGADYPRLFFAIRGVRKLCSKDHRDAYKRRIFSGEEMVRSLEGSLRRLKRDYVDDFLIHEPLGVLADAERQELHHRAQRLKDEGKIVRWGVAGPFPSLIPFEADPAIDVLQFPLRDRANVSGRPSQRRIAYGVYRAYVECGHSRGTTFTSFVNDTRAHYGADLIVATTSPVTLATYRELF